MATGAGAQAEDHVAPPFRFVVTSEDDLQEIIEIESACRCLDDVLWHY